MPFELFVAIRYLLARRKQVVISIVSLISMVGVAAGVMALIVALALNSGFQKEFQERILSATTHITLQEIQNRVIQGYDTLADQLGAIENVVAVSPTVYSQALLQSDLGRSRGVYMRGIDPGRPQFMGGLLDQITEGDAASFGQKTSVPEMIVGEGLAEALGLLVGDQVRAVGMRGELAPFPIGRTVRTKGFKITAIFKSGLWEFDANWALIPLREAQAFEGMSDQEVSALEFQLGDIYQARATAEKLRSRAGKTFTTRTWMELNRPLFSALQLEKLALFIAIGLIVMVASLTFTTRTWMELNRPLFSALQLEKLALFIAIGLIVMVASLNIIITLTMMVMEKTGDIAVIAAMGGLPSTILRIFMFQGVIIGVVGTCVGAILGCALVWYLETYQVIALDKTVYSISYVPFELRWVDVVVVSVMAVLVSSLATVFPARAASRLNPVEGLRYD